MLSQHRTTMSTYNDECPKSCSPDHTSHMLRFFRFNYFKRLIKIAIEISMSTKKQCTVSFSLTIFTFGFTLLSFLYPQFRRASGCQAAVHAHLVATGHFASKPYGRRLYRLLLYLSLHPLYHVHQTGEKRKYIDIPLN